MPLSRMMKTDLNKRSSNKLYRLMGWGSKCKSYAHKYRILREKMHSSPIGTQNCIISKVRKMLSWLHWGGIQPSNSLTIKSLRLRSRGWNILIRELMKRVKKYRYKRLKLRDKLKIIDRKQMQLMVRSESTKIRCKRLKLIFVIMKIKWLR